MKTIILYCVFFSLFVSSCAIPDQHRDYSPPPRYESKSNIPKKEYSSKIEYVKSGDSNPLFSAELLPCSEGEFGIIQCFILRIKNKVDRDLKINWNETMFIENGQTNGCFMFSGIVYSKRNELRQSDVIFSNSVFTKKIWPNNKVFLTPRGEWEHEGIYNVSGVYLVVEDGGKKYTSKLLLKFDYIRNY